MDAVTLADADTTVVLRDVRSNDDEDQYAGASFVVELHADGLDAMRCVCVFAWDGLDAYLTEIAEAYRGWDGVKTWTSPQGDLNVEAEADRIGHNTLRFTARDGPLPTWWATVTTTIAAGEDMANLAAEVTALLSPLRST